MCHHRSYIAHTIKSLTILLVLAIFPAFAFSFTISDYDKIQLPDGKIVNYDIFDEGCGQPWVPHDPEIHSWKSQWGYIAFKEGSVWVEPAAGQPVTGSYIYTLRDAAPTKMTVGFEDLDPPGWDRDYQDVVLYISRPGPGQLRVELPYEESGCSNPTSTTLQCIASGGVTYHIERSWTTTVEEYFRCSQPLSISLFPDDSYTGEHVDVYMTAVDPCLSEAPGYRPNEPVMSFVPQNVGIDDKLYCEFQEPECRGCHGASTASLHHNTTHAKLKRCLLNDDGCHEVIPGPDVEPIRDCKMCHIDDDPLGTHPYPAFHLVWGDKGSPHHWTDEADSNQCNQCHSHIVETFSVEPPNYNPSEVTPTPASCENCHWWDAPVPGTNPNNPTGEPIHAPGSIVTWGPTGDGIYPTYGLPSPPNRGFDPVALPSSGTHETPSQKGWFVGKCWLCHWSQPDTEWDTNPYNPYAIRYCENCHSEDLLHGIEEHVYGSSYWIPSHLYTGPEPFVDVGADGMPGTGDTGENDKVYTVGEPFTDLNGNLTYDIEVNNKPVTGGEKCWGCHGANMPPMEVPCGPPIISDIEPGNEGSRGMTLTVNGANFGDRENGDDILIGNPGVGVDWIHMPIVSWVDNQIEAQVPVSFGLPAGTGANFKVRVYKAPIPEMAYIGGYSNKKGPFALHPHPLIDYLDPFNDEDADMIHDCGEKGYASWGDILTIWGSGFGAAQESVVTSGYGYVSYAELHASADIYRVRPANYTKWQDNKVKVRLEDFYDVNTGTQVPEEEFYVGDWEVKIVRAYVTDTNGDGDYMNANGSMDWETGADTLEYQEISEPMDPLCPIKLFVTKGPLIRCILPEKGAPLTKIKMMGENFGTLLGDSVIHCIKQTKVHLLNATLPNYYGAPPNPAYPLLHPSHKPLDKNNRTNKIKLWTNTKIKFKIPTYGGLPKKIAIRVDVYGETPSNVVTFKMKP